MRSPGREPALSRFGEFIDGLDGLPLISSAGWMDRSAGGGAIVVVDWADMPYVSSSSARCSLLSRAGFGTGSDSGRRRRAWNPSVLSRLSDTRGHLSQR
jgi:hypothetical protein